MRVLYVSHTPEMSGAEYSLLELIAALEGRVEPIVASPQGPLADRVRERGIAHVAIGRIDGGSRLHPVHTTKSVRTIARGARTLRRVAAELTSSTPTSSAQG